MGAMEMITPPTPVTTRGSTSTSLITPMTGTIDGRKVKKVRVHVRAEQTSGDEKWRVTAQNSDDGINWSAATTITGYTTYSTAAGWTYGSTFATLDAAPYIRFAMEALNVFGSTKACTLVTLALELTFS